MIYLSQKGSSNAWSVHKRMFLVPAQDSSYLNLQSLFRRCCTIKAMACDMRYLTVKELKAWLEKEYLVFIFRTNLDSINFPQQNIKRLEKSI